VITLTDGSCGVAVLVLNFYQILFPHFSTQKTKMSIAHGIRTLGVLGAGQMGTQIIPKSLPVSALHARVPVLLYDRSNAQIQSGLALMEKLLAKDVSKGKITPEQASEARERVTVVDQDTGIKGMRDVDMVVEVRASSFCAVLLVDYAEPRLST